MSTEYMRATTAAQREALARKIARLRLDGAPWNDPGGIVDSMRLVSFATQGRALLRKHKLDTKHGGPVEIRESYNRYEINPRTGHRKGFRERKSARAKEQQGSERLAARSATRARPTGQRLPSPSLGGDARHAPIKKLVRRIRREMNAAVRDVDPDGPGVDADVLLIMRDPGRLGALTTGSRRAASQIRDLPPQRSRPARRGSEPGAGASRRELSEPGTPRLATRSRGAQPRPSDIMIPRSADSPAIRSRSTPAAQLHVPPRAPLPPSRALQPTHPRGEIN